MAPKCTALCTARELFDLVDVGDRIKFDRTVYEHWAIAVAKNEEDRSVIVIHYTDRQSATGKAVIREDKLEDAANGDKCAVDNSLDSRCKPLSPDEIVKRARSRLGEATYCVRKNNCEHLASWCRNGIHYSHQVKGYHSVLEVTGGPLGVLAEIACAACPPLALIAPIANLGISVGVGVAGQQLFSQEEPR
ncbi:Group XVI phospholipase A2 [Aphelenchoides avenae]|nr:Group XVI phospholipase A2 [Aphelenchus avenae]